MKKVIVMLLLIFAVLEGFCQSFTAMAYGFMKGTLIKGKWQYSPRQKVKKLVDFNDERIAIKDSSGINNFWLLKDVLTKRIEDDSCITSLRTGYDNENIRCMINLVEFYNGMNVLNIMYAKVTFIYYFRRNEN